MAKSTPKPKKTPRPTQKGTGKKSSKVNQNDPKEVKKALKPDTRQKIQSAATSIEFQMHLDYLNLVNSGAVGGDFEEFKQSWAENFITVSTGVAPNLRPEKLDKKQEGDVVKLNKEAVIIPKSATGDNKNKVEEKKSSSPNNRRR